MAGLAVMATGDDIGGRGESIFYVLLTDYCGRDRPYFRPHFLGEKFATLDYLVELIGAGKRTPFFFVQVKATRRGYTKGIAPARLKVRVSRRDVERLALYPAPTYVVGVDEKRAAAFIVCVRGTMKQPIPSLPTSHLLDCRNLKVLWDEVKQYWDSRDMTQKTSAFSM